MKNLPIRQENLAFGRCEKNLVYKKLLWAINRLLEGTKKKWRPCFSLFFWGRQKYIAVEGPPYGNVSPLLITPLSHVQFLSILNLWRSNILPRFHVFKFFLRVASEIEFKNLHTVLKAPPKLIKNNSNH